MEENNSFKNKALSHIPKSVVDSMMRQEAISTDGLSPLEAIAKTLGKGPLPTSQPVPQQQEQFLSLAVDGNVIKVPADATKGAVVMFMYILATELSKNKKIAKILKQFNFTMFDANNIQIYPKKKVKK